MGLGGVRIARELSVAYSLNISPRTIYHWIHGYCKPPIRNIFKAQPSRALSYVIGANIGDGCNLFKSGCVKLEVTDLDFAKAFNSNMPTLFSRIKPNKVLKRVFPSSRLPLYIVKYVSRQLADFLNQPLRTLLEFAFKYPREFLRGFFDGEGHVDVSATWGFRTSVGAENSDRFLLLRIRLLLKKKFQIDSKIYCKRKEGSVKTIRGKSFIMKRTSYGLNIGKVDDVKIFARKIGFSIFRKSQKLDDALSIMAAHIGKSRNAKRRQLYLKKKGEWVRRDTVQPS